MLAPGIVRSRENEINIDIVRKLGSLNSCQVKHLKVTEKSISIKGLNVNRIIQVQIIKAAI